MKCISRIKQLRSHNEEEVEQLKVLLKQEWRLRKCSEYDISKTPLLLAVRQGDADAAELFAKFHVGDWTQEILENDESVFLYCLNSDLKWLKVASQMASRMKSQIKRHSSRKTFSLYSLLKSEQNKVTRSQDIAEYLAKQSQMQHGMATALHIAAFKGLEEIIDELLACGMEVDTVAGANNYTPLCFAILGDRISSVSKLIELGANPNLSISCGTVATLAIMMDSNDATSLIHILLKPGGGQRENTIRSNRKQMLRTAVQLNKYNLLKTLAAEGCETDGKDAVACFRYATKTGLTNLTKELILSGIVINATDLDGNTPLIMAIGQQDMDLVEALLSRNSNTECKNKDGKTFWHFLLEQLRVGKIIFDEKMEKLFGKHKLLLKAADIDDIVSLTFLMTNNAINCDITYADEDGNNIFHHAARNGGGNLFALLDAVEEKGRVFAHLLENLKCTESELQRKICACINELPKKNVNGQTPLHLACENGSFATVQYLIQSTDIGMVDNDGKTVFHYAAANLKSEQGTQILKWLIKRSANDVIKVMNAQDKDGNTPLHIAVTHAHLAAICLMEMANPNQVNNTGISPLQCALFAKTSDFFPELLEIIERNDPSLLHLYIFLDSHVNQMPLLHNVANLGQEDIMRLLIRKGANVLKKDKTGNTVLHHIALLISQTKHTSHSAELLRLANVVIDETAVSKHHIESYLKHILGSNTSSKPIFLKMKFLFYLARCIPNHEGKSVLTYAADLGAIEYVEQLLQPITKDDGLKLANDWNFVSSAAYDVTFLTPQCLKWANYKTKTGRDEPNKESLLDVILKSDRGNLGIKIFDIMPMTLLLKKFISVYQWFYFLILAIHLVYMVTFTYFSVTSLDIVYHQHLIGNISNEQAEVVFNDTFTGNDYNYGAFLIWPLLIGLLNLLIIKDLFHQYRLSVSKRERLLDKQLKKNIVKLVLVVLCSVPFLLHYAITLAWYIAVRYCNLSSEIVLRYFFFSTSLILPVACICAFSTMKKAKKRFKLTLIKLVLFISPFLCNAFLFLGISHATNDCLMVSNTNENQAAPANGNSTVLSRYYYGFFLFIPCIEVVICLCCILWFLTRVLVIITTKSYHIIRDLIQFIVYNIYILATFTFIIVIFGWYISLMSNCHGHIYFLAASLIVGWIYSIHFTHCFPGMHMFAIIFKRSLYTDAVRFVLMYGFVTAGFSCAINVLSYDFPEQLAQQRGALDTMYQALKVTVGLGDLVDSSLDFGTTNYYAKNSWAGLKLVYILYIIISNIVLLNILIAMVSRTFEQMADKESVTWREWRYNNIMFVMRLPKRIRQLVENLGNTESIRSHIKSIKVSDTFTMLILFVNDDKIN